MARLRALSPACQKAQPTLAPAAPEEGLHPPLRMCTQSQTNIGYAQTRDRAYGCTRSNNPHLEMVIEDVRMKWL